METTATILHADLDAFYASVEQLLDPSLRSKPIAVGGGVVLAASYEAKHFGVRGGMSGWQARELCPQLIFVGGHFGDYQRLGDAAIKVLNDFTPLVERISIDEAFADVAGCTHLFGSPAEIASAVRRRVRTELGLPISVGVARTKHLAKIASQVAKPDGLVIVDPATELDFLHNLPVERMWGVGPVTKARLAEIGVLTIGQLAKISEGSLTRLLGPSASEKLTALALNRDPRQIKTHRRARSAGAQSALGKKPAEEGVLMPSLRLLADRVASRLRAKHRLGRTVTVRVRFGDLRSVTRSVTLDAPISATVVLAEIAEELVRRTDEVAEHHSEIAPLGGRFGRDRGRIRRCSRCSLRRYRRRCDGRRHRGVAQFGDGCKYFPAMPERDADVLEILIRQEAEYRDINFVLGKALRVLPETKLSKPVRNLLHAAPRRLNFPTPPTAS